MDPPLCVLAQEGKELAELCRRNGHIPGAVTECQAVARRKGACQPFVSGPIKGSCIGTGRVICSVSDDFDVCASAIGSGVTIRNVILTKHML